MSAVRVIGVTRALNEAPIIEACIRHHAGLLNLHIILDHGSTDTTVPIVRQLHAEGLLLQLYTATSPLFAEAVYLTGLYRLAVQAGADWVLFLDCDELLDVRRLPGGLHQWLAAIPADVAAVALPQFDYRAPSPDTDALPNLFDRLVQRQPAAAATKLAVRGLAGERVTVGAGSHSAVIDGVTSTGVAQDLAVLAHYPQRTPAQAALKSAVGRLKILAEGSFNAHLDFGWHYTAPVEALQRNPRAWLAEQAVSPTGLVYDPGPYTGGSLRYTAPPDDDARLVALLLTYAERLARSHGQLLDLAPDLREALLQQAAQATRLL